MAVETKRICNGTFGELWLDGDYVGECYKARAKVELQKRRLNSAVLSSLITRLSDVRVQDLLLCTR